MLENALNSSPHLTKIIINQTNCYSIEVINFIEDLIEMLKSHSI